MLSKKFLIQKTIALLLCIIFLCGCVSSLPPKTNREVLSGFSVHFIDVGEGDCIFIRLPDQKNVLIDCGSSNKQVFDEISSFYSNKG